MTVACALSASAGLEGPGHSGVPSGPSVLQLRSTVKLCVTLCTLTLHSIGLFNNNATHNTASPVEILLQ